VDEGENESTRLTPKHQLYADRRITETVSGAGRGCRGAVAPQLLHWESNQYILLPHYLHTEYLSFQVNY